MNKYDNARNIMSERFGKGTFYISTYALSNKMIQVKSNPEVAVCAIDWFSGHGNARNLGWMLDPKNTEIRLKLRDAFEWYDKANNEQDQNCCILEVRLTDGMLIKDHHAVRHQINFTNKFALLSENWGDFK